ncbi:MULTISPECIES: hypothetical protein [Thalassospira]|uniref:Uncharacterized protein n=1 Tax=Thalassospira profundimaris TaxID=502049 RepID=A0A367V7B0_9PROT|nr:MULTISPECIES: hypothetical protein [Thalassospira]KZB73282.1 hypothetical protein AUQ43_18570 [Thalassospira sp. MCCC 1A01148]RCK21077.1 hypothetical protein TH6_15010 [Thalassospira profundimaris]
MTDQSKHMRGDEILLLAEIKAATAMREAFESLEAYIERFPGAPINRDEFIRRVGLRATNQDDAA